MKIGNFNVTTLETGTLGIDGGAMFGVVPKPLWTRTNPADEQNRITLSGRVLFLENENQKIIVDTGTGVGWKEKFANIFRIEHSSGSLYDSLAKRGIKPEEITDVIITHLHFDHIGGAVNFDEDGNTYPAFPNAKYHVNKKQFDWAKNPSRRDRASYFENRFMPMYETGQYVFHEGDTQLADELEIIEINGHTPGQQLVKVSDGENTILYCADLIPTAGHVPLPFIMGFDLFPLTTLVEKLKFLPKAAEENWLLVFEHDPENVAVTVRHTEKDDYAVDKRFLEI
jgi:glyoxylase-like metal-dependent hydrolase (beta-lactamase superfamily II)